MENNPEVKIINKKPIVSYWKSGDPCLEIQKWRNILTEINVFNTKRLTDEFIDVCLIEKNKIFLHVNITGMGKTPLEPNIPTVKETFFQIKKLIDKGFPQKQILVIVNPILPNENGLRALSLLLRVFTEFKMLRLRNVRFVPLHYVTLENNKFTISNKNISTRVGLKPYGGFLVKSESFIKDYYKLIEDYKTIIIVDKGDEALIGIRELIVFGYKNEYIRFDGVREKIVNYEKNNRFKPIVNIISAEKPIRCVNKCLLCPWLY